jgi:uncharacterized Zn finger protein (UPF0148 family)
MSGFDEEAERERLREKYEQDQEKRAATQRMSELLLKGATMTNSHCDACGDPLFRHDGQTFCPTCQTTEQGAGEADASAEAGTESESESASASPSTADADPQADDPESAAPDRRAPSNADAELAADAAAAPDRAPAPSTAAGNTAGASLDDARASLSRTLVRYARAAEETDDPRRATELLGAAREAAETLAALDRR